MDEALRNAVWTSRLQADQEQRYWHRMACRYVARDFWAKVFLAIVTSGTVAGWTLSKDQTLIWQSLSALASILAIILPIMSLNDKVLVMTEVHSKWLQLMHGYDAVWRDQSIMEDVDVRRLLESSKTVESELSGKAINLPGRNKKLGAETYKEVIQERNS